MIDQRIDTSKVTVRKWALWSTVMPGQIVVNLAKNPVTEVVDDIVHGRDIYMTGLVIAVNAYEKSLDLNYFTPEGSDGRGVMLMIMWADGSMKPEDFFGDWHLGIP